jgi:hypothetical protein
MAVRPLKGAWRRSPARNAFYRPKSAAEGILRARGSEVNDYFSRNIEVVFPE